MLELSQNSRPVSEQVFSDIPQVELLQLLARGSLKQNLENRNSYTMEVIILSNHKFMEQLQLIVRVTDKDKAEMLTKILTSLDFVNSVEIVEHKPTISDDEQDFFSLAGLWANRDVTTDSIRQQAWREDVQ